MRLGWGQIFTLDKGIREKTRFPHLLTWMRRGFGSVLMKEYHGVVITCSPSGHTRRKSSVFNVKSLSTHSLRATVAMRAS
jgi:hypothetical protein